MPRGIWIWIGAAILVAALAVVPVWLALDDDGSGERRVAALGETVTSQVIVGCYDAESGNARILARGGRCSESEVGISWNQQGPPGPKGDQGEKGDPGLRWRGAWDAQASYAAGEVVSHGGASWVAQPASEGTTAGHAPPTNLNEWSLVADKGSAAPGYEIALKQFSMQSNTTKADSVFCATGKEVLGGGFEGHSGDIQEARLYADYPRIDASVTPHRYGWEVKIRYSTTSGQPLTGAVFATCADIK